MSHQTNWAAFIAAQAGVVPAIEGDPGEGKTAIWRSLAEHHGRRFIQFILGQKLREDIGGVPVPATIEIDGVQYPCVRSLLSEEIERARREPTVWLFDELNQTSHDVLGAAQEWINNPPANCWMAAAYNPVEHSTSGLEFSAPVVNRMCLLKWEKHNDTRRQGWANGFRNFPTPEFPTVSPDYLEHFGPKWGQLLCDFEDRKPIHFTNTFPEKPEQALQPWRSDRSWTNCGKLLAAAESCGASKAVRFDLACGCVGRGPATEFLAYVDALDLPSPSSLIADPSSLVLPKRFDLARAIISGVIGHVKREGDGKTWEKGYDVLEYAFEQQREVAISAHGTLWQNKPSGYEPRIRDGVAMKMQELVARI